MIKNRGLPAFVQVQSSLLVLIVLIVVIIVVAQLLTAGTNQLVENELELSLELVSRYPFQALECLVQSNIHGSLSQIRSSQEAVDGPVDVISGLVVLAL